MKIVGQVRIKNKIPEVAFVPEAIYIPAGNGYPGGLFDNNLNPIPQAVSHRGKETLISPPISSNIDVSNLPLIQSDTPYFFIGEIYGHFGHFLLESTARLWPFLDLLPEFSGKYLYCGAEASPRLLEKMFIKAIFGGFSLETKDFVTYPKPCRLKNVFVAPPAFEIRLQGHSIFRQSMQYIGTTLAGDLSEINNTNLTPVYLSKSKLAGGVSKIINEIAIEESLSKKGVDIWHPETVDLPAQIREISSRKYILGSVGSAFHTLLFCPGNKIVSGVVGADRINSNYIIIDKLCGNIGKYATGTESGIDVTDKIQGFKQAFFATDPERVADILLGNIKKNKQFYFI